MSANPIHNPSASGENELIITRLLAAPRDLVYAAWTEPQHLDQWQNAPQEMTVTVEKSDIRTGGEFRIVMREPNGTEHRLQGKYLEVVTPERLVFTHTWLSVEGKPGPETLVTIAFAERGNQTELTLRQTGFTSADARDGHSYGWTSTFDRLADYLATLNHSSLKPATDSSQRMKEKK